MANVLRPSPLAFNNSGRQSPFKRQNSVSPATTARSSAPTQQEVKLSSGLSPSKQESLSPEKISPFARRPSQLGNTVPERSSSPLARPLTQNLDAPRFPTRSQHDISTPGTNASPSLSGLQGSFSQNARHQSPGAFHGNQASPRTEFSTPTLRKVELNPLVSNKAPEVPIVNSSRAETTTNKPISAKIAGMGSSYSHVPQPLLRSMRESFEVLDINNSGVISAADVQNMLEQMGLESAPSNLREFFPPSHASQLNLTKYLDILAGPLGELSSKNELLAAFSAFDVDDSGQIDVAELRSALSNAMSESDGSVRISQRDIDEVLGQFSGRREFGSRDMTNAKGKGDVFKYRDFMSSMTGGVDAATTDTALPA